MFGSFVLNLKLEKVVLRFSYFRNLFLSSFSNISGLELVFEASGNLHVFERTNYGTFLNLNTRHGT